MILADKILIALFNANSYSADLASQIVDKSALGEDVCELEWKLILLGQWIRILQVFYDNNFSQEGEIITPSFHTITLEQAESIMAKLKVAIGNNKYPINMFSLGIWIDSMFYWDDVNDTWYDSLPLT